MTQVFMDSDLREVLIEKCFLLENLMSYGIFDAFTTIISTGYEHILHDSGCSSVNTLNSICSDKFCVNEMMLGIVVQFSKTTVEFYLQLVL